MTEEEYREELSNLVEIVLWGSGSYKATYAFDLGSAMEALLLMQERGCSTTINLHYDGSVQVQIWDSEASLCADVKAKDFPFAVCLAILKALGVEYTMEGVEK